MWKTHFDSVGEPRIIAQDTLPPNTGVNNEPGAMRLSGLG